MSQRYLRYQDITDEAIVEQFRIASLVKFSARPFNRVCYRAVSFGDLGWWIPLSRVLPLIGITPTQLRPVFNPQYCLPKRPFPFNLSWFGSNKNRHKSHLEKVELPEKVESYDDLGFFRLDNARFCALAQILGKSVEVWREDGGTGEHYPLFTAYPDGKISKV